MLTIASKYIISSEYIVNVTDFAKIDHVRAKPNFQWSQNIILTIVTFMYKAKGLSVARLHC